MCCFAFSDVALLAFLEAPARVSPPVISTGLGMTPIIIHSPKETSGMWKLHVCFPKSPE